MYFYTGDQEKRRHVLFGSRIVEYLHSLLYSAVRRQIIAAHRHPDRIPKERARQFPHCIRPCCTEHQRLPILPILREPNDLANIVFETPIQHPVCLVQDKIMHFREIEDAVVDEVENTSWRTDDYTRRDPAVLLLVLLKELNLALFVDTTEDGDATDFEGGSEV